MKTIMTVINSVDNTEWYKEVSFKEVVKIAFDKWEQVKDNSNKIEVIEYSVELPEESEGLSGADIIEELSDNKLKSTDYNLSCGFLECAKTGKYCIIE